MPRTPRSNRLVLAAGALVPVVGSLLLTACGDDGDDGGGTAEFCDAVAANQDTLFGSAISTVDDGDAFVALYREVGDLAPLAIEDEWDAMTALFETALAFEPDTTEVTEQEVLTEAYSSEQSALAVRDWLAENCQITIVVGTVPPPALNVSGSTPAATG